MQISLALKNKLKNGLFVIIGAVFLLLLFEIYIPYSVIPKPSVVYNVQSGLGAKQVAADLRQRGIIKSSWFFTAYVVVFGQHANIQAGTYDISSSMSIADIVRKFVFGDVIKNNITVIEGWGVQDIASYFESKGLYSQKDFLTATKTITPAGFDFLKDRPKNATLEGYLFPDTYQLPPGQTPSQTLQVMLVNFGSKLTPDLRKEIASQHKSLFQVLTMAAIIEKEVQTPEDKKIVSGILWKRIDAGIPLQVDSTINYVTGKPVTGAKPNNTNIDSPYNTYKYYGLPPGPICNPGMDSILAAIYPKESPYWYYLSAKKTGKTIFSKTLDEQNAAIAKYLQ